MAASREMKEKIVLCNILPAGLYGVEATHVNKGALQSLRSAIADAIGPSSAKRNVNLVFECTKSSRDLDPQAHILYLRVASLRRMMAKHKDKQGQIRLIIRKYNQRRNQTPQQSNSSTGGEKCQDGWDNWPRPLIDEDATQHDEHWHGPVGLLIECLAECGCTIDDSLHISAPGETIIDMWNLPWQHLRTAIIGIATRSRQRHISCKRTFCGNIGEIDQNILKKVVNHLHVYVQSNGREQEQYH